LAAGLAVMVTLGFPPPVLAGGGSFVIANTASGFPEPVPRGAMLSIFTDAPVSGQERKFVPWVTEADDGLFVQADCTVVRTIRLPIRAVRSNGHEILVYYPNGMGDEPFGRCDNDGISDVVVQPAGGFGPAMSQPVVTVNGHPGIFSIGVNPDGLYLNGLDGKSTRLSECAAAPAACPVRTQGLPARLRLTLTGAEMFICNPCPFPNILFELALVVNGVVGTYQQQKLLSLTSVSTGMEEADIELLPDLTGGEYRLRVRQTFRPEFADPLTVLLGPPN
jgi:hypothetical protein